MSSISLGYLVNWKALSERCSREGCNAGTFRHTLAGRKVGIRLGGGWFCSPGCFQHGVESQLRRVLEAALRRPAFHPSRMPMGLLLLSRGCITHSQLQTARGEQRARGRAIGDVLCELRFATEQDIAAAAATQWGCPVFSPREIISERQARIPHALMRLCFVAPVHYAAPNHQLLIGFVHAIEHHVLQTIEQITSCKTTPCFITASDFARTVASQERQNTEIAFERVASASEIASILQSYAFEIGSEEVRIGICRNYVWARLNRENTPTDLLFALRPPDVPESEHELS